MRYRDVQQAFFVRRAGAVGCVMLGLRRPRLLHFDLEGSAVFGDAVDGVQQLPHGRDEREFGGFSGSAEALVECPQPGVSADGAEDRHPEGHSQVGVSHGGDRRAGASGLLSGLFEAGHGADIGGKGCGASEAGRVADGGDDAGGGLWSDTLDGGEQLADLVGVEQVPDIALDVGEAFAPEVEVLADVRGLQFVGGAVVLADGGLCGLDQLLGELRPTKWRPS